MNFIQKWLTTPAWLTTKTNNESRVLIVAKGNYQEHVRRYNVSSVDLIKVIRNELKVLSQNSAKVLWKVVVEKDGAYRVLFAVLNKDLIERLSCTWCMLIPESWILYRLLVSDTLYRVNSDSPYWAWLDKDAVLHTTTVSGLMSNPRFFLDALGRTNIAAEPVDLNLHDTAFTFSDVVRWKDLPGLICLNTKHSRSQNFPWRKFATVSFAVLCLYMSAVSGYVIWQHNQLQNRVTQLQQAASALFERQQALQTLASTQALYSELFERYPSVNHAISALLEQLPQSVELESVAFSGQLAQVKGSADSATEVLSALQSSAQWQEVKFDSNVRRNKEREFFTISFVIAPKASQEAPVGE